MKIKEKLGEILYIISAIVAVAGTVMLMSIDTNVKLGCLGAIVLGAGIAGIGIGAKLSDDSFTL